jgi:hypothetical protein
VVNAIKPGTTPYCCRDTFITMQILKGTLAMVIAPNDSMQNPIEDIWLQAKRWLRECYHQCKTFASVKTRFELSIEGRIFDFPKLNRLGEFSFIS